MSEKRPQQLSNRCWWILLRSTASPHNISCVILSETSVSFKNVETLFLDPALHVITCRQKIK